MSPDLIRRIFQCILDYRSSHDLKQFSLIWHGGEPFSLPVRYYEEVNDLIKQYFPSEKITSFVQTNLTTLSPAYKEFLTEKEFFESIGFSFDPFGDQRVTIEQKDSTEKVLENLAWLQKTSIPRTGITVLTRKTLPYVAATYYFFDQIGIPVRFLPFYKSSSEEQENENAVTGEEILNTFTELFYLWSVSKNATPVDPINRYIDYAVNYLTQKQDARSTNLFAGENLAIDLEGNVWSADDDYGNNGYFGNIIEESLEEIFSSDSRIRRNNQINQQVTKHCLDCKYFGACPAEYVRYSSSIQREIIENYGCLIRAFLDKTINSIEKALSAGKLPIDT